MTNTFLQKITEKNLLLLIIFSGFVFRLVTVTILDFQPISDYASYQMMAINLLSGKGIIDTGGNLAMYNVGYPLFILTPVFALFNNSLYAAQIVNSLLGTVSIFLCYLVADAAGAGRWGRLSSAAIWAIYLPSWVYAEYLAKENLMIPLILGTAYCALRLAAEKSYSIAIICGSLFGLLALSGNSALSLALPIFLALLLMQASIKQKISIALLILAVTVIISAPWAIRNHQALGVYTLNTNGGLNLYLGNNPSATGMFISIADTPLATEWHKLRATIGEAKTSETFKKAAIAWITEHPVDFITLAFKKALLFWIPPTHDGQGDGSMMETIIRKIWLVEFVVICVVALGSAAFSELRSKNTAILWLSVLAYTAVHMLFYVIFRYREPIMPILCVIAALAIERFLVNRKLKYIVA